MFALTKVERKKQTQQQQQPKQRESTICNPLKTFVENMRAYFELRFYSICCY